MLQILHKRKLSCGLVLPNSSISKEPKKNPTNHSKLVIETFKHPCRNTQQCSSYPSHLDSQAVDTTSKQFQPKLLWTRSSIVKLALLCATPARALPLEDRALQQALAHFPTGTYVKKAPTSQKVAEEGERWQGRIGCGQGSTCDCHTAH